MHLLDFLMQYRFTVQVQNTEMCSTGPCLGELGGYICMVQIEVIWLLTRKIDIPVEDRAVVA